MAEKQRVIYRARHAVQAYLLKNLLAEEGIRAEVTNALLADGAGVDILGWPTLARVLVDESNADRARQIALEFDRAEAAAAAEDKPDSTEPPPWQPRAPWPHCPDCGAPRLTACPACGTSGACFPPADAPQAEFSPEAPEESAVQTGLVICPTCDEPFVAGYLARCEWCGHEFEPGQPAAAAEPPEEITPRVWAVVAAIVVLVAAVVGYLALILR